MGLRDQLPRLSSSGHRLQPRAEFPKKGWCLGRGPRRGWDWAGAAGGCGVGGEQATLVQESLLRTAALGSEGQGQGGRSVSHSKLSLLLRNFYC